MADAGTLVLVVGPSGAGKDTLISGARTALSGDPRFVFPRRVITRPATAGGEAHVAAGEAEFQAAAAAGEFALHWAAHGLRYGVPRSIEADLAAGRTVVVNVSRQAVEAARARFPRLRVILVTAPPELLADRLAARRRETGADLAARLDRKVDGPHGADVTRFENAGSVAEAVGRFTALLRDLAG